MDLGCSWSLVLASVGQIQDRRSRDEWVLYEPVDLSMISVMVSYWKLRGRLDEIYQALCTHHSGV